MTNYSGARYTELTALPRHNHLNKRPPHLASQVYSIDQFHHRLFSSVFRRIPYSLIVKVVVSKNIYFLFVQVIRYCSVPDVSINKLSTFIGNHVRHRILPDHHHFE